jgi:hypothetical protein
MVTILNSYDEVKELVVNDILRIDGDLTLTFDLIVSGALNARNIKAKNIKARDINAWNINAWNINALDIKAREY